MTSIEIIIYSVAIILGWPLASSSFVEKILARPLLPYINRKAVLTNEEAGKKASLYVTYISFSIVVIGFTLITLIYS
jgi:hypothetical protein